jgi:hypothetical protein
VAGDVSAASPSPHRRRFGVAYFALAAIVGAAIGSFIVLYDRPGPTPGPAWSNWEPSASDSSQRVREIADHVAGSYRLASHRQLVGIIIGPPSIQNVAIRAIAVRAPGATSASDISIVDPSKSVMVLLCGFGKNCSIREGAATKIRGRLVRREALELALYTFKFVDGVDSVVAFLPPRKGAKPTHALFFRRADFADQLDRPLARTLPRLKPPTPAESDSVELGTIDRLTLPRYFRYQFQQAQDGSAVLVLDPAVLLGQ